MKILLATMPFEGHFGPLTSLAVHLKGSGHDVRWYAAESYAAKLMALGIERIPFARARDVNAQNLDQLFPEYAALGSGPKAIEFALTQIFFGNLEAHYRDIADARAEFPFDVLIADGAFYAARLVAEKLGVRVYVINPAPSLETSRDVPPPFFGLLPSRTPWAKLRDWFVRRLVESSTRSGRKLLAEIREREGLAPYVGSVFDLQVEHSRAIFQIGVPGLDFPRSDAPRNFEYVGALLPQHTPGSTEHDYAELAKRHDGIIVVSQGTVDNRDPEKLLVPTLEALGDGPRLVVAATGYRHTEALRRRFSGKNVLIEDFVDFRSALPHASLFVCNGGFGSVLLALSAAVPLVNAGKLEGKSEVNARVAYSGAGIDLRTERPTPNRVERAVQHVLGDPSYARAAKRIAEELASYAPLHIIESRLLADAAERTAPATTTPVARA